VNTEAPPDITTMRESVDIALIDIRDSEAVGGDQLETLVLTLRGHIEVLLPEVEALAGRLPKDDIPARVAIACMSEAREKLRIGIGQSTTLKVSLIWKLARSVRALCDHFENLGGPAGSQRSVCPSWVTRQG
jgi:hypothetical protein